MHFTDRQQSNYNKRPSFSIRVHLQRSVDGEETMAGLSRFSPVAHNTLPFIQARAERRSLYVRQ
jgi:hypothetical protein